MSQISMESIKILREKSGAGMMDCKRALSECNGDIEAAVDFLRKKGLAAAAKKASRVAAEGLISLHVCDCGAAIIEVNAETDFVARNELFQKYTENLSKIACCKHNTIESLSDAIYLDSGKKVSEELLHLIAIIGENMNIRRLENLQLNNPGVISSYVHNKISDNAGKIGVLVVLESSADKGKLQELGKKIAMHIAAANPQYLGISDVDAVACEREKAVLIEQIQASGKKQSPEIVEKMIQGRMRKFYEDIVLLEQVYVMDTSLKISQVIENAGREFGCDVKLTKFVKYVLGEGIEKTQVDFAAEVAAQLQ